MRISRNKKDNDYKAIIMNDFHLRPSSEHVRVRRILNTIKERYYWPVIKKDVKYFVKKCSLSQMLKYNQYIKETDGNHKNDFVGI